MLVGPVSLLYLGKDVKDAPAGFSRFQLLDQLLPAYVELLKQLLEAGAASVQIDEPILVFDLPAEVQALYRVAYAAFAAAVPSLPLVLTTKFGEVTHNISVLQGLPVAGVHVDLVRARHQLDAVLAALGPNQTLSLGIVDGRNMWKPNFQDAIATINTAVRALGSDRVIVASSSSLLHTPHTLESETGAGALTAEIQDWFSFGDVSHQKAHEGHADRTRHLPPLVVPS